MAKLIQDLSIGGNLRKLREARGLTQEDVCARMAQLGRPMLQSAYSQIETGRRNLFVSDLIALRTVLDVYKRQVSSILFFVSWRPSPWQSGPPCLPA